MLNVTFSGSGSPVSEVNGIWYHSSQGLQYIKLAMGEEALSAKLHHKDNQGSPLLEAGQVGGQQAQNNKPQKQWQDERQETHF